MNGIIHEGHEGHEGGSLPDFGRPRVEIFTRMGCPGCAEAKRRLREAGIAFGEFRCNAEVGEGPENLAELMKRDVALSFPAIFVNGTIVGLETALTAKDARSASSGQAKGAKEI